MLQNTAFGRILACVSWGLAFPQKPENSEKDIHYLYSAKCSKMTLWYLFHAETEGGRRGVIGRGGFHGRRICLDFVGHTRPRQGCADSGVSGALKKVKLFLVRGHGIAAALRWP